MLRPPGAHRQPESPALRLASLLACTTLCLAGCSGKDADKKPPPPLVDVMVVRAQPVPVTTELTGRTVASLIAEVRPQVSGIVIDRLFAEGGEVRAGQPLYRIDSRIYAAASQQAAANLGTAQATVEANRLKAERFRVLAEQGGVSRQDATDALAAYNQSRAQVAASRAALATAQVNLGFTRITAPISGRIGRSTVTRGALVTASQADAMAKIQRLDPLYVDIKQSSNSYMALRRALDSGRIATGSAPVQIVLADGTVFPQPGHLDFADVDVGTDSGTVTLRVTVPNPRGELLPGLFVKARLVQAVVPNGILVPQGALSRTPRGMATVYVVNAKGEAESREVTAETAVGNDWLVTSGLKPGERVIVQGLIAVKPGAKVRIAPPGKAGGKAVQSAAQ